MAREPRQMNKDDRQLHNIYKSRLANDLCSKEEKEDARRQIDRLEHKGAMGAALDAIEDFEERLGAIELIKGRGKQAFTRKMFDELKTDIEELKSQIEGGVIVNVDSDAAIASNKAEITSLWADRRTSLEGAAISAATTTRVQKDMQELREKNDVKYRELEAQDTKILKALSDVIGDAVDEAKTAIMAEAHAAAVNAVAAIVGTADKTREPDAGRVSDDHLA